MKRVVINADDLGMGPGVNAGIARAVATGLVREASLCVTGAAVEAGLAAIAGHDAGVGLHFSLTHGCALTGPLSGLTDAAGRFLSLPRVLAACTAHRVDPRQIEAELLAQLERARELGVEVTHLDGHHHAHLFPVVSRVVIRVARQRRIAHLRVPVSLDRGPLRPRVLVLGALARAFRRRVRRELPELEAPRVIGLNRLDAASLGRIAPALPEACEWIVHPREAERDGRADLELLLDPRTRDLLDAHGVSVCRFRDLR